MFIVTGNLMVDPEEVACIRKYGNGTTGLLMKSGEVVQCEIDFESWQWLLGEEELDLPTVEIMSVDQEGLQDLMDCLDPECEIKIFEDDLYFKYNDSVLTVPEGSIVTEKGVFAPVKVYKAMLKG